MYRISSVVHVVRVALGKEGRRQPAIKLTLPVTQKQEISRVLHLTQKSRCYVGDFQTRVKAVAKEI